MLLRLGQTTGAYKRPAAGALAAVPSLQEIIPSAVFDFDATVAASYGGSGALWKNLVAQPADGSAQGDHDMVLGDGTDPDSFPVFTGAPGSAGAYWAFDGTLRYFITKLAGESDFNTAFAKQLPRSINDGGTDWWFAFAVHIPDSVISAHISMRGDPWNMAGGFNIVSNNSGKILVQQMNDSGANARTFSGDYSGGDFVFVIAYEHSTNTLKLVANEAAEDETWGYGQTTVDPPEPMKFGVGENGNFIYPDGQRLYSMAAGNAFLSESQMRNIQSFLAQRHNRGYGL